MQQIKGDDVENDIEVTNERVFVEEIYEEREKENVATFIEERVVKMEVENIERVDV